jgi:DNA-binding transcriptional ArsR family regulator
MMSPAGRPTGFATATLVTLLAALIVAPGAVASPSFDADVAASVENTAEGLDVAAEAAAEAAAAGAERTVEVAADAPTVPTPDAADGAMPEVDETVEPEFSTPDWSPVDAEASADVQADSSPDESGDEAGTRSATTVNSGPAWSQEAAVAAGFVALLGAAAASWTTLKGLVAQGLAGAIPMFSRLDRDEVLDNETRQAIYDAIQDDPGLCTSEICDRVDAAWGTAVYHLKVLEDNHFVVSMKHGRHRRFFENGGKHKGEKEAVATLQNETTAEIYDTIRSDPGLPQKEIADRVDLTPQALAWHLNRLKEAQLLEKERDGRVVRHYAGSDVAAAPA